MRCGVHMEGFTYVYTTGADQMPRRGGDGNNYVVMKLNVTRCEKVVI